MTKDEAMKLALDALIESRDEVSEAAAAAQMLTGYPSTDRRHQYLVEQLARHDAAIGQMRYALAVGNIWRSHDNDGMRFPEASDLSGGETDAEFIAAVMADTCEGRAQAAASSAFYPNFVHRVIDGWHVITSPDVPGLYIASTDLSAAIADLGPAVRALRELNQVMP